VESKWKELKVPEATLLRTVVSRKDAGRRHNGLPDREDDRKVKIFKYIPAETVAFYTASVGAAETLKDAGQIGWYWGVLGLVFLVGLAGTPAILKVGYGITWKYKKWQIIISTVAYVLWVLSIGTYQDIIPIPGVVVTIILGIYTFLVPIFLDPGTNTSDLEPR
jgi:hypothetical protein